MRGSFLHRGTPALLAIAVAMSATEHTLAADDVDDKADTMQTCLDAFDLVQTHRTENKLVAAREKLLVCVRDVCPQVIRNQCIDWLEEVERDLPTVVLSAQDSRGQDLINVVVNVDGELLVRRIDGTAVPVDPGMRVFRFQAAGHEPVETEVMILVGFKSRPISAQLAIRKEEPPPPPPQPLQPAPETPETPEQPTSPGFLPYVPYVLGGVGVVGIGASIALGFQFKGKLDEMDKCKPHCPQSDADSASTTRILTFVSAGVGVAAIGVGTYFYFAGTFKPKPATETARIPWVDVTPMRGGAVGTFGTTF